MRHPAPEMRRKGCLALHRKAAKPCENPTQNPEAGPVRYFCGGNLRSIATTNDLYSWTDKKLACFVIFFIPLEVLQSSEWNGAELR